MDKKRLKKIKKIIQKKKRKSPKKLNLGLLKNLKMNILKA